MIHRFKREIDKFLIKRIFFKNKGKLVKPYIVRGYKYFNVGNRVRISKNARIECYSFFSGIKLNPKIVLGDRVIIRESVTILVTDSLVIGDDTIMAHNVTICTENHGLNPESNEPYSSQPLVSKAIYIGKNCWIGANVCILPGGNLGDNCVVAANSVVNKSFPNNVMVGGVPAKILKVYNNENHCWEIYNRIDSKN